LSNPTVATGWTDRGWSSPTQGGTHRPTFHWDMSNMSGLDRYEWHTRGSKKRVPLDREAILASQQRSRAWLSARREE